MKFQSAKIFCTLLLYILLSSPWVLKAENGHTQDSIIDYLNQFADHQIDDSTFLKISSDIFTRINPGIFTSDEFEKALIRIQNSVPEDKSIFVKYYLLSHACFLQDNPNNAATISFGWQFIDQLKNAKNQKHRFFFLKAFRNLRIPYRNSELIYDGIKKYSEYASAYHQANDSAATSIAYNVLGSFYNRLSLMDKAVYYQLKSISYNNNRTYKRDTTLFGYRSPPNIGLSGNANRKSVLGYMRVNAGQNEEALVPLREVLSMETPSASNGLYFDIGFTLLQMVRAQSQINADSALHYIKQLDHHIKSNPAYVSQYMMSNYYLTKGQVEFNLGNLDSAEHYTRSCLQYIQDQNLRLTNISGILTPNYTMANILVKRNKFKDAIEILKPEIKTLQELNARKEALMEIKLLAEICTLDNDFENAAKTYKVYTNLLNLNIEEERENRSISFDIEQQIQESEQAVKSLQLENAYNRKRQYYLLGILGLTALLVFGLFTRNRFKNKVNKQLTLKNEEIQSTLQQLKATQSQLIQSEKMASLGELTAGIAHEIQNPLNFVNNFAEINTELIDEMQEALDRGDTSEAVTLAGDIKDNEKKIVEHGKRADGIVKSMLQHSRSGSIEKEEVDLNKLVDEYIRLAYHGLRAKDKSFNAKLKTNLDPSLGNVNLVQQDFGRVLLNLINNAFYAVYDRQKNEAEFDPVVSVHTRQSNKTISIEISDNGSGIPKDIQKKIFQPFFTTKPAGEGTGLGLSMSYDIIKAHGGDIQLKSEAGQGTTFTITLPI